jgi:predicted AAA+ superfamily ATPase
MMILRNRYKTVLERLALFPAVALLGPRQAGKTTLAEDIEPDKSFVVYAGDERYPIAEGVDAIGLSEMAQMLLEKA